MPFCKVCYDAKRPESEYTGHYVKDQPGGKGIIVCPTLLNQACRICHNTGHTSSYCPQYRRREEPRREEYRREEPRREEPRREEYRREEPRREEYRREEPRREEYRREELRREEPRREEYRREEPRRKEYHREEYRRDDRDYHRRPRVRLNLEAPALYASKHAETNIPPFDVLAINLGHVNLWGDENVEPLFLDVDPVKMCDEFINSFK